MSTDVQMPPKSDIGSDKQSRRRSKDSEKAHRRSSNFQQNKKHKHDHKFRKRSQSFTSSNGKFFPPYKMRKKDFCPPTKFLLGGNITDPLNLNSLQDEEINRAMNAVTPKSSPLPTPTHRKGEIEVIIPPDITDPLNLIAGDDDATYEAMLISPVKRSQKKPKKNKKRRNHRSSSGPGSGKEDSIEGAKLDESDPSINEEDIKTEKNAETKKENESVVELDKVVKEPIQAPPAKKHKPEGYHNRNNLRKMELKDRKADLDKIVSPVIPQPGAWHDRHRFRPPPRTPQINKTKPTPKFKESNAKFQYGNYNRYYGYRNPNMCQDVRLKVLEKHKSLFRGKDVLDIGCNTGHLTLAIARDLGPNKVLGMDIDRALIQIARNNIKHYVNCGRKDKFFPVSMPIVYGPIDVPGISEDKAFPHNISFVQGNYVLESDVLLSLEQPQFDVIMCLSITKWIHLNWGDAGLKRAFRRMYSQLRPGGVLILEAQCWNSYQKKKQLTPETWKNYHSIELFPHQFSQFLLSEVGFSKCEVIGAPIHHSRGFQRPIKLFIKEDPSFDTPVYESGRTQQLGNTDRYDRYSFRLPDSVHMDEFSADGSCPYGTPSSVNSAESGFSECSSQTRRYPHRLTSEEIAALDGFGNSQNQRVVQIDAASTSQETKLMSVKRELLGEDDNTLSQDSNSEEVQDEVGCNKIDEAIEVKENETSEQVQVSENIEGCEDAITNSPDVVSIIKTEQTDYGVLPLTERISEVTGNKEELKSSPTKDQTVEDKDTKSDVPVIADTCE